MKKFLFILLTAALLHGCSSAPEAVDQPVSEQPPASSEPAASPANQPQTPAQEQEQPKQEQPAAEKTYGNDIFQKITVAKTGEDTFEIKGQARVFEGHFQYVVEDGHNELADGTVKTSVGAPEWGDFSHTLQVKKDTPNSTLMLILFEVSAKDGSRQHELIIPLPEK